MAQENTKRNTDPNLITKTQVRSSSTTCPTICWGPQPSDIRFCLVSLLNLLLVGLQTKAKTSRMWPFQLTNGLFWTSPNYEEVEALTEVLGGSFRGRGRHSLGFTRNQGDNDAYSMNVAPFNTFQNQVIIIGLYNFLKSLD